MAASVFGRTIGSESGRSLVLLVARLKDRLSLTFFIFFTFSTRSGRAMRR